MALRVLLADESTTIKKVFQLALQDYAVEVTSVAAGLDVLPAARQFKPDIVFCDILLQKKNGYEVCAEFKADPGLNQIPVVLMWSGFMELDKDKLEAARADGRLEKPFDVQQLRQMVQKLVPRTQNQRLGQFLKFPKMPEMLEASGGAAGANASAPPPPPQEEGQWNMESFDPIPQATGADPDQAEEFQEVPLPPTPKSALVDDDDDDSDGLTMSKWSTERLKRFNLKDNEGKADQLRVGLPDDDDDDVGKRAPPSRSKADFEIPLEDDDPVPFKLTEAQVEAQIREQARGMIEAVVWKVVPELATQIIERELKRLLDEKGVPPQP